MNVPDTAPRAVDEKTSPYRIALLRRPRTVLPADRNGDDYQTLRRMLENALFAARNAERQLTKQTAEIERLRQLSITDAATGLLNRRGFADALDRAIARGKRYDETAVLLLIDLDSFKPINDRFGHPAGDLVLAIVADTLRKSVREVDDVARLGGDEFAVILSKVPEDRMDAQADAIEAHLNRLIVPWNGDDIAVQASVGRYCFGGDEMESAQAIYDAADSDMYRRKRNHHRAKRA